MTRLVGVVVLSLLVPFLMACGTLAAQVPTPTTTLIPTTNTPPASATPILTDTAAFTDTPAATETTEVATISPLLTNIPGIQLTMTQAYLTPGIEKTLVANQTAMASDLASHLTGFSDTLLKQCPDPSDVPKNNWVDIPVMSEATAGQQVDTLIGSYYCFRAPVTGADVEAFYKARLTSPSWTLQADANSTMQFFGLSQSGIQLLFIVYAPSQKNDLLVAINVTVPLAIPTQKP